MRLMGAELMLLCLMVVPVSTSGLEINPILDGIEMIVWVHQNWESNGGYNRLTIWRDGRSEVEVAPLKRRPHAPVNLSRAVTHRCLE